MKLNTLILASVLTMTASMQAMDQKEQEKTSQSNDNNSFKEQAAAIKKNADIIKANQASRDAKFQWIMSFLPSQTNQQPQEQQPRK